MPSPRSRPVSSHVWRFFIGFALLSRGLAPSARADLYEFVNGGTIETEEAERQGGVVTIRVGGRSFSFLEKDFRRIEPREPFVGLWQAKLRELKDAGVSERLDAAVFALERGRVEEAAEMIEETATKHPSDDRAGHLKALLQALRAPKRDPDTAKVRSALDAGFAEVKTPNVLFLHQNKESRASRRSEFLERIVSAFYLEYGLRGVALELPRSKLICVEWSRRSEYLAFLKKQNAGAFQTTIGFYHPTLHAMICYQSTLNPDSTSPVIDPKTLEDATFQDALRRTLIKTSQKLAEDLGTSAHEMIHLLVSETKLLGESGEAPIWLHEGLAMQYEAIEGGRWGGIDRVQEYRLREWRRLPKRAKPAGVLNDDGFGKGYNPETYAKAWALVYFLKKTKPQEFQNYLDRLRLPSSDFDSSKRSIELFQQSFGGDLDRIEREWRETMFKTRLGSEMGTNSPTSK